MLPVSVICNNLVPDRCTPGRRSLLGFRDHYCQDTEANIPVRLTAFSEVRLPRRVLDATAVEPSCRMKLSVILGFVRILKITPGSAVPFRNRDVVLVNSFEHSALGLQESGFSHPVFER